MLINVILPTDPGQKFLPHIPLFLTGHCLQYSNGFMNKIIVALDSLRLSKSAVSYAMDFSKKIDARLVAVFLDDFTNCSYKTHETLRSRYSISQEAYDICIQEDNETRKESIAQFKEMAGKNNLKYTIHHDRNISLNELVSESSYADLVVVENKETMSYYAENPPTHFMKNLLREIRCPVLIVPEEFREINKVLFLYDGEPYSLTAIRMFSYLFPVYNETQTEVLTVTSDKRVQPDLNNHLLKEYMNSHFPNTIYTVLNGLPDVEIIRHLKYLHENELIVLGSYHRGQISRIMRPSIAEALMRESKTPIFIDNN
jgi:nucleotide-binding universal stress UspA family protein